MKTLFEFVSERLKSNGKLLALLSLVFSVSGSNEANITFPKDRLIGDWTDARPGDRVSITWSNPYRIEHGFLFSLPGLKANDFLKCCVVQIPRPSTEEGHFHWFTLKHLTILADTIELEPIL